jgi:hypothetical protein
LLKLDLGNNDALENATVKTSTYHVAAATSTKKRSFSHTGPASFFLCERRRDIAPRSSATRRCT